MSTPKLTDSLAPFRRRARWRQVWRWLRWVLLVLLVVTLLLGGVVLRTVMADTGLSVSSRDAMGFAGVYTGAILVHPTIGVHRC